MPNTEKVIAQLLLDKQAVKISTNPPFTWTSGIKSPIYCDNRLLISYPDARDAVLAGFKELIQKEKLEFDVIGGTSTAAIPWAAFLAHELRLPMVYIRPKPKEHGAGRQVEGTMKQGSRVIIIEDLISTGGSSVGSANACIREFDATIVGIAAIFSYELAKGKAAFAEAGLKAFALSNFSTLVSLLDLPATEKEQILTFTADPAAWWEKFNN